MGFGSSEAMCVSPCTVHSVLCVGPCPAFHPAHLAIFLSHLLASAGQTGGIVGKATAAVMGRGGCSVLQEACSGAAANTWPELVSWCMLVRAGGGAVRCHSFQVRGSAGEQPGR